MSTFLSSFRDFAIASPELTLAVGGLVIGVLFGALIHATNFCTMGAISDAASFGDTRRLRAWILSIAVAILGTQALAWAGVVDVSKSMYLGPSIGWVGSVLGGLMFGTGMVFAGGCTSRNLARAGGGDIRALVVVIVIGLFAYMTIGGILGPARSLIDQMTSMPVARLGAHGQDLGSLVAAVTGVGAASARGILALIIGIGLIGYTLVNTGFRRSPLHSLSGVGVGLLVVAGWALTGLAFDDLADKPVAPISLTFVRPSGDTLEWLQRYTALGAPSFGVACVFGALAGAALVSLIRGRFRLVGFNDTGDTVRSLLGAALMGTGGVLGLGCTVGQGITGVSTLSVASILTLGGIVAGGILGLRAMERWIMAEA